MSESDFIKNLRTVFVALKEGRDGYLSHSWYQEYPRECDFLVSLGLCKETHPAVGGKRLELADAHTAALASSKPSPAFEALKEYAELEASWSFACDRRRPGWSNDHVMQWANEKLGSDSMMPVGKFLATKRNAALALAEKEAGTTPPAK